MKKVSPSKCDSTVANFATSLRASSFILVLENAGIPAIVTQAQWNNKKLPPPRYEVNVPGSDFARASDLLAAFKAGTVVRS